jgi:thiamine-phosphate pyrophosphorylase
VIVVLTDRRLAAAPLVDVVRAAVAGGAARVVLRDRDMAYAERLALAEELREFLGDRLTVAGPDPLGGSAVHLSAQDPLVDAALVGRSCHGADDLERLSTEDYVTLSPIFPTATKPGYGPALTPAGAAALGPRLPWLALGGVDRVARAAECAAAGAAGVAVMGAVMRAADPERLVAELRAAFVAAARAEGPSAADGSAAGAFAVSASAAGGSAAGVSADSASAADRLTAGPSAGAGSGAGVWR